MIIKKTTEEVINIYYGIENFIKKDVEMPRNFVWYLEENQEKLHSIVHRFEKLRDKKLEPLKEKGAFEQAENEQIKVKAEYVDEFLKIEAELQELLDIENEIDIKTVCKNDVPEKISNKDWNAIKFMCTDEEVVQ